MVCEGQTVYRKTQKAEKHRYGRFFDILRCDRMAAVAQVNGKANNGTYILNDEEEVPKTQVKLKRFKTERRYRRHVCGLKNDLLPSQSREIERPCC